MWITVLRASVAAMLVAGCATAGDGVGSGPDAHLIQLDDAGNPIVPDAGGGPGTPDAGGGPGTPDAFVPGLPDASVTPTMCTLVPQSGCMSGMACDLVCTMSCTTGCRAITVAGTDTSTCAGGTGCAAGYVCLGDGTSNSCFEYCTTDSQCMTGPGALCVIQIIFGTPPMDVVIGGTPVKVCSRSCNPITSVGCPTGWGCHVYQEEAGAMRDFTDCNTAGTGVQGTTCVDNSDCSPGYTCVSSMTSTFCAENCRLSPAPTPSDCGSLMCNPLVDMPTIAGQEYGVCI